jgi:hypothetical protein
MNIQTPNGLIEVLAPEAAIMSEVRNLLPFGIAQFSEPQQDANYGFVMCCGDQEVWCIKQQPLEQEQKAAEKWLTINHVIIIDAYTRYLAHGFSGGYLASPYIRQREYGLWESGIAHFIFPAANGIESQKNSLRAPYDSRFGPGATTMLQHFILALRSAYNENQIEEPRIIGLDLRPRSHLNSIAMHFMVVGSRALCLRAHLRELDPAWGILAKAGIKSVIHLPSVPLTIRIEDLHLAKGN